MSFAAFLQQYVKPSRWWRRERTIQFTIWPRWLAQALCPHKDQQPWMWSVPAKTVTKKCIDCHKNITSISTELPVITAAQQSAARDH